MFIAAESFDDISTSKIFELIGVSNDGFSGDKDYNGKTYVNINGTGLTTQTLPDSRRLIWGGLIIPDSSSFSFSIRFCRNGITYFAFSFSFSAFNVSASFSAGSQYQAIDPEGTISGMFYRPFFLEVLACSIGATNAEGFLKVAINGVEVCSRFNVVTSAYDIWGSQVSEPASYFNQIKLSSSPSAKLGQMYICNEQMGYRTDFVGPFEVSSCYPELVEADTLNWIPYLDNKPSSGMEAHVEAVGVKKFSPYLEGDRDFIEADLEGVRDLFYVSPPENFEKNSLELYHVKLRSFHRQIYDSQYVSKNSIFPVVKPSGRDLISRIQDGVQVESSTYKVMDNHYNVYPDLAVPWSWQMLTESQFGIETKARTLHLFVNDFLGATSEIGSTIPVMGGFVFSEAPQFICFRPGIMQFQDISFSCAMDVVTDDRLGERPNFSDQVMVE